MCIGIPGKVMNLEGGFAEVDYGEMRSKANVKLVDVEEGVFSILLVSKRATSSGWLGTSSQLKKKEGGKCF